MPPNRYATSVGKVSGQVNKKQKQFWQDAYCLQRFEGKFHGFGAVKNAGRITWVYVSTPTSRLYQLREH